VRNNFLKYDIDYDINWVYCIHNYNNMFFLTNESLMYNHQLLSIFALIIQSEIQLLLTYTLIIVVIWSLEIDDNHTIYN
jgi:hypothetical protein